MHKKGAKQKVLVFLGYYLPRYKAGGPIRTISGMVDVLSDRVQFYIVTRDRDCGDNTPYTRVEREQWTKVGNAYVMYYPVHKLSMLNLNKLIMERAYDFIYLNSFFDFHFSLKPFLVARFKKIFRDKIILAPRGEFSEGALKFKSFKKKSFISLAKAIKIYSKVCWQASSQYEFCDIQDIMGVGYKKIKIALDLVPNQIKKKVISRKRENDKFKLVFLSRISPMKNLLGALKILAELNLEVDFDIYGVKEDKDCWLECENFIMTLPDNINTVYKGEVKSGDHAQEIFACYDLFLFPTYGENYGHVIAESLSVGTPVLISDTTPWRLLSKQKLGWDLQLSNLCGFVDAINYVYKMTTQDRLIWRQEIVDFMKKNINSATVIQSNYDLFECFVR